MELSDTFSVYNSCVAFSLAVVGFGQHARSGGEWGRAFIDHAHQRAQLTVEQAAEGLSPLVQLAESIVARMEGEKIHRS